MCWVANIKMVFGLPFVISRCMWRALRAILVRFVFNIQPFKVFGMSMLSEILQSFCCRASRTGALHRFLQPKEARLTAAVRSE